MAAVSADGSTVWDPSYYSDQSQKTRIFGARRADVAGLGAWESPGLALPKSVESGSRNLSLNKASDGCRIKGGIDRLREPEPMRAR